MIPIIVIAVAGIIALGLIVYGVVQSTGQGSIDKRLERFTSDASIREPARDEDGEIHDTSSPLADKLDKAIGKSSYAQKVARELAMADLRLTVAEFLVVRFMVLIGFFVLGLFIGRNAGFYVILVAVVFAVLGVFVPKWFVAFRKSRRLRAFNNQLGDTITLMANSLRSGYSLLQSMELIAREAPSPMADEFTRVIREVGLGLTTQEALGNIHRRVPSDDLDFLITAMNIQHEVGGNLAQILDIIGLTIRERIRIKGEIKSLTAQGEMTAYVITALPVGLGLVMMLISPEYAKSMFKWPWICMPICSGIMIFVGFVIMRKMVRIEV